mmetsp:Transcript_40501/g.105045  ORF Transcript_40501/g.105045 Transcript_40501/m.105045 type:complete len:383 (-) Transcript_40501:278-1426(-)
MSAAAASHPISQPDPSSSTSYTSFHQFLSFPKCPVFHGADIDTQEWHVSYLHMCRKGSISSIQKNVFSPSGSIVSKEVTYLGSLQSDILVFRISLSLSLASVPSVAHLRIMGEEVTLDLPSCSSGWACHTRTEWLNHFSDPQMAPEEEPDLSHESWTALSRDLPLPHLLVLRGNMIAGRGIWNACPSLQAWCKHVCENRSCPKEERLSPPNERGEATRAELGLSSCDVRPSRNDADRNEEENSHTRSSPTGTIGNRGGKEERNMTENPGSNRRNRNSSDNEQAHRASSHPQGGPVRFSRANPSSTRAHGAPSRRAGRQVSSQVPCGGGTSASTRFRSVSPFPTSHAKQRRSVLLTRFGGGFRASSHRKKRKRRESPIFVVLF